MPKVTQVAWADRILGDIGCLRGRGLVSDAIILGERLAHEVLDFNATWSHIFVVAKGKILEAIEPKISLSPWNVYDGQPTALFRIEVDPALKRDALLQIIHEYVGRGYDLTGVALGMGALEILRQFDLPWQINLFAGKHRQWCSELGTRYIRKLIPDPANPETTDPQQVYNYLRALTASPQ
ncbi:MAG TPA: hypothetical protein VMV27_04065 [Candidatus Binataceae bacterium]|nr:hypothetical protein [Candidatus Binataceae bacterium]